MKTPSKSRLLVVMGPTASGKSGLAMRIASKGDCEIVGADSMQIYKDLAVGTAQPPAADLQRIPHHLVGILPFSERLDVCAYEKMACSTICGIHVRAKTPLLCGGTGFYIKTVLRGLDPLPGDDALRARIEAKYSGVEGMERLVEEMRRRDPAALDRIGHHRRRLIRALEILELSGKTLSELQSGPIRELRFDTFALRLEWETPVLKTRIRERTAKMLESGWIEEAERAIADGLLSSPTARQAIGYDLIYEHLKGKLSREELLERVCIETWQYAKRQNTWFRRQHPEAQVVRMPDEADDAVERAVEFAIG